MIVVQQVYFNELYIGVIYKVRLGFDDCDNNEENWLLDTVRQAKCFKEFSSLMSDVRHIHCVREKVIPLLKVVPFVKQSFFQMINVTDPAAVHSLLQNSSDRSDQRNQLTDFSF